MNRRKFNKSSALLAVGLSTGLSIGCDDKKKIPDAAANSSAMEDKPQPFFKLSLAQWSLHKEIQAGTMDPFSFARKAKELGFTGLEYVSDLYNDWMEAQEGDPMRKLGDRLLEESQKNDMENLLIMIDGMGDLGIQDEKKRLEGVENHKPWIDMAQRIGCHAIRLNLFGDGTYDQQLAASTDSMKRLGDYGATKGIHVLVENHGGYSSDPEWVVKVMKGAGSTHIGTLPDFGNFCIEREGGARWSAKCINEYPDYYKAVEMMMPYAKAVSAKSYAFDKDGYETKIDYPKMLQVIKDAGYKGYIGVEYEGEASGAEGSLATKELLLKAAAQLK